MDDDRNEFALRYVGRRFNRARLPLDVLAGLPALRDLIAALAKQEFRNKNIDRKRIPRGFDKSISFSLTELKGGSAVPIFELDLETAQQSLPSVGGGVEEIVHCAYQRVVKIFDDAGQGSFPQAMPLDAIQALTKLGANIQDNEYIEFCGTTGADGNVVRIDAYRRKNLLTRVRETYTFEFESVGILTGIEISHNTIQVQTEEYGELRFSLDRDRIRAEQFDGNLGSQIEFSLLIDLDANDSFKAIKEVRSVDLVNPYGKDVTRCINRLQELARIEKGWLGDRGGERLVHLVGMRANQMIFMRPNLAELFRIFPTEDGGVSLEFDMGKWSFAVEVLPDGTLEIDGSSKDDDSYELKSFDEYSKDFFDAFDSMIAVAKNE